MKKLLGAVLMLLFVIWNGTVYYSDKPITVVWDSPPGVQWEVKTVLVTDRVMQEFPLGIVSTPQVVVQRPRSGFFEVWVKDVRDTEWSKSSDAAVATVGGTAREWRLFFTIPAPGSGGIE